jgi:chromosome segregation ATPase
VEFQEVARELYTADPAGFTPARDRQAAAAQELGAQELAAQIKKLRKPTTAAWAVNLLAAHEHRELAALLDLGDRLRSAQRELRGDDLRSLAAERTRLLRELTDRAAALAQEHGHPLAEPARQQVEQTLTAALSDPEAGRDVQAATLAKPLEYSGFGLDELAAAAIRRTATKPKPTRRAELREQQREAELRELREQLRRTDEQLGEAEDSLATAERAEREAEQRCEELRDELASAESELRERHREARTARQRREHALRDRDAQAERLRRAEARER